MSDLILFWHRRDLRIFDNLGLATAAEQTNKIVGVFCLDPNILERDDIAPARVTYMMGCLQELKQSYSKLGSQLLIINGDPHIAISQLAIALKAKAVFWNTDVEPYAKDRDRTVAETLKAKSIEVQNFWDQLLHAPGDILTKSSDSPYKVYTPFWRTWNSTDKQKVTPAIKKLSGLTSKELAIANGSGVINLPSAKDLGYEWITL